MASMTDPFSGSEMFNAPAERVFAVLSNPASLAEAAPGLVSAEPAGPGAVRCVIKPGLSFIGGSVKATLKVVEAKAPGQVMVRIESSGIGMKLNLEATFAISPATPAKSALAWSAAITEMSGLVKAAPAALVRAAAEKVITDGWASLRKKIEA